LWRDDEDYLVDWSWPAERIRRFVDAVGAPYKGAASIVDGKMLRLLKAEALPDVAVANRTVGKVIFVRNGRPVVTCGSGLLRVDELVEDASGASVLPLRKFRTRFKGRAGEGIGNGHV
jgi:methionyl-tRNA formyltransferase